MTHTPDNWVILKFKMKDGDTMRRILCGWSGGYLTGDSWRLSTEPKSVVEESDCYVFTTASGSKYVCGKESQCIRMNCAYVLTELEQHREVENVEILEFDIDTYTF